MNQRNFNVQLEKRTKDLSYILIKRISNLPCRQAGKEQGISIYEVIIRQIRHHNFLYLPCHALPARKKAGSIFAAHFRRVKGLYFYKLIAKITSNFSNT